MTAKPARSMATGLRLRAPELLLAAAATLLVLFEIWVLDLPEMRMARSVPAIAAGASLAFLRTKPFAAYLVNGAAIYALIALGYPSDFYQWTNLIAIFGAASRLDPRRAVIALLLGVVGVSSYFLRFPDEAAPGLALAVLAVWLAAWFGGRVQYGRVRELELIRDHDLIRAQLSARQAEAALVEERGRIARDLHDIIGHSVNVMVLHAGGGKGALRNDPTAAESAFETIAATGRKALADLDRMLDLLHGESDLEPLPGIEQLDELCRSVTATGLAVDLDVRGPPLGVDSSLGLTVYRIVQEALTNVMKHSGASRAQVELRIADGVTLTVTDNGVGTSSPPGRGLSGIRERSALHSGSVEIGRAPEGGLRIHCVFPPEEQR